MLTKRKSKNPLIVQMTLKKFFFLNMHKTNNGRIVKIKIIGPLINTPTAEINQKNSLIFKFKKLMNYQKKFDLVHIHGIWAPIQLFSIIYYLQILTMT